MLIDLFTLLLIFPFEVIKRFLEILGFHFNANIRGAFKVTCSLSLNRLSARRFLHCLCQCALIFCGEICKGIISRQLSNLSRGVS